MARAFKPIGSAQRSAVVSILSRFDLDSGRNVVVYRQGRENAPPHKAQVWSHEASCFVQSPPLLAVALPRELRCLFVLISQRSHVLNVFM